MIAPIVAIGKTDTRPENTEPFDGDLRCKLCDLRCWKILVVFVPPSHIDSSRSASNLQGQTLHEPIGLLVNFAAKLKPFSMSTTGTLGLFTTLHMSVTFPHHGSQIDSISPYRTGDSFVCLPARFHSCPVPWPQHALPPSPRSWWIPVTGLG